jgi:glycerol-3-phosphate acyltransferase PlsY
MEDTIPAAVGLLLGYGIGSISFALLAGYLVRGIDIRVHGSGNVGATNVGRILGRSWGFVVYVLDFGKGLASVLAIPPVLAAAFPGADGLERLGFHFGLAAILGHMFPFYLRFRGGKGVATGSGVFLSALPVPTLIAFGVWGGLLLATRYMAVASIAAAGTVPIAFAALEPGEAVGRRPDLLVASVVVAALVVVRHRANLRRLRDGTEHRIGSARYSSVEERGKDA